MLLSAAPAFRPRLSADRPGRRGVRCSRSRFRTKAPRRSRRCASSACRELAKACGCSTPAACGALTTWSTSGTSARPYGDVWVPYIHVRKSGEAEGSLPAAAPQKDVERARRRCDARRPPSPAAAEAALRRTRIASEGPPTPAALPPQDAACPSRPLHDPPQQAERPLTRPERPRPPARLICAGFGGRCGVDDARRTGSRNRSVKEYPR